MATDWNSPTSAQSIDDIIAALRARDVNVATMFDMTFDNPTNIPEKAIRWNGLTHKFEQYDGVSVWSPLNIASGISVGSMALQNAEAVSIIGGTIGADTEVDATCLTGIVDPSNLGSGGANSGTFLAGDSTYKTPVPIGSGAIWFTGVIPSGWLLCNGQAISRVTYALLFAILGTTYGAGDGVTTFNVPDLRGRLPFGKANAGTGSALAGTFGTIDHTHTGPLHNHTYTDVVNHTHPAVVTDPGHKHTIPTDGAAGVLAPAKTLGGAGATTMDTSTVVTGVTVATSNPVGGVATGTTSSAGTGITGDGNPPCLSINFIIKAS